jgi:thiamine-phosphate pyrophosphorylase
MTCVPHPLLVVTDRHQAHFPLEIQVAKILASGGRWIWFREKDLPPGARRPVALRLSEIVHNAGGCFTVGGDIDLAEDIEATAAHVSSAVGVFNARRRLGKSALVGMSAHGLQDVADAKAAGADYVTLSPIYLTASKPGYGPALGTKVIEKAIDFNIPVVALGGISMINLLAVRNAGASAAAVMGSIMRTEAPELFVSEFLAGWSGKLALAR